MLSTKQVKIFAAYNEKALALGFSSLREAGALAIECMNAIKAVAVTLTPHAAAKAARVSSPNMTRAERVLAAHKARYAPVKAEVKAVEVVKPQSAMTIQESSVKAAKEAKVAARKAARDARKVAREQARANRKAAAAKKAAVEANFVVINEAPVIASIEVKDKVHPVEALLNIAEEAMRAYEANPSTKTKVAAAIAITNVEKELGGNSSKTLESKSSDTTPMGVDNESRAVDACVELNGEIKKLNKEKQVLTVKYEHASSKASGYKLAASCYEEALRAIDPKMAAEVASKLEEVFA